MDSMVDSFFDQYERGRMTRRHLVQALAALVLPARILAQDAVPAPAPIVRGLSVNHVQIAVSDLQRSTEFYGRLFGVKKGWPTINAATGVHLDLPDGYISISLDAAGDKKGVIGHFAVGVDHLDAATQRTWRLNLTARCQTRRRKPIFSRMTGCGW